MTENAKRPFLENMKLSLRVPIGNAEEGINFIRELQNLCYPTPDGKPCEGASLALGIFPQLNYFVTNVLVTWANEWTGSGRPLHADVEITLLTVP